MRIRRFAVSAYGPLRGVEAAGLGRFNLIYGPNEEGKTLTMEALIKLLSGPASRKFENMTRVPDDPEGVVEVESGGRVWTFPRQGDLRSVFGIHPEEARNVFFIRNSDLSIGRESDFYTGVADRLTGLETSDIAKVKIKLLEAGRITEGGRLKNDQQSGYLLDRVRKARAAAAEAEKLVSELSDGGFETIEEKKVEITAELEGVRREAGLIEEAGARERHEKSAGALENVKRVLKTLEEYRVFEPGDLQEWRDLDRDAGTAGERGAELRAELEKTGEETGQASERIRGLASGIKTLEERCRVCEDEIEPKLALIRDARAGLSAGPAGELAGFLLKFSAAVMLVSAAAGILRPGFASLLSLILGAAAFASAAVWKFKMAANEAGVRKTMEEIRQSALKAGLDGDDFEGISAEVFSLHESLLKARESRLEDESLRAALEKQAERTRREKIPALEEKKADLDKRIDGLRRKSGVESLQEYRERLNRKQELERELERNAGLLEHVLGVQGSGPDERMKAWEAGVSSLGEFAGRAMGVVYDPARLDRLRESRIGLEGELERLERESEAGRGRMKEVEKELRKILGPEPGFGSEDIICETLADLRWAGKQVESFLAEADRGRDDCMAAVGIMEEIDGEEREKVSSLFSGENSVSDIFSRITGGNYSGVVFDKESVSIKARRKDGVLLSPPVLSGGTYDQLYLSVRLSLAVMLTGGRKSFFMMDDPFIKADYGRLKKQMEILREFSEDGWQVIYFTAKDEVRNLLREAADGGEVRCFSIGGGG